MTKSPAGKYTGSPRLRLILPATLLAVGLLLGLINSVSEIPFVYQGY